jgi:hypothetical protein
MKFFRQHIIFRYLCVLLALHIFNVSVDMPDAQPDYIAEDLTINDQESIVELVFEKVLGVEDAFAEHDEQDESNAQSFEMSKDFKLYNQVAQNIVFIAETAIATDLPLYKESSFAEYIREIPPRPPRA